VDTDTPRGAYDTAGDVVGIGTISQEPMTADVVPASLVTSGALDAADVDELFPEQRRAFDIVQRHLALTIDAGSPHSNSSHPTQLLMLIVGEGGTGKSKVIQTITGEFDRRGASKRLLKSAYTGMRILNRSVER
jgi:hypothetical protein